MIKAVYFDVGETLVDETREYGTWADWLGVPRHTFSSVFGAVIARGGDYRDTFQFFKPGFDLGTERRRRAEAGEPETFGEDDLYSDVRPCLSTLRGAGVQVGVAGNQTARAETLLKGLDLPVDVIGTSDSWGCEKPDPSFFEKLIDEAGHPPEHILYVGDRLDNDVRPAQHAGLQTAVIRRGPWGHILQDDAAQHCVFQLTNLAELPSLVERHNAAC